VIGSPPPCWTSIDRSCKRLGFNQEGKKSHGYAIIDLIAFDGMIAERWLDKEKQRIDTCAASDGGLSSWKPPELFTEENKAEAVTAAERLLSGLSLGGAHLPTPR
jgi:hypothetical protein